MTKDIVVIGSGGHAKVVIATAQAAGFTVVAVFDDDLKKHGTQILSIEIQGGLEDAPKAQLPAVIAIGNNKVRKDIATSLPCSWISLVHPSAILHETVQLGEGSVVFAGVVVQPDSRIGDHVILNTSCSVDHDNTIEDWAHIAPGASLCGGVCVGQGSLVGVGASMIPYVELGDWSILAAGGVLTQSKGNDIVCRGVPAI